MTKTYIKPETIIVNVESQQILAGSPQITDQNATTDGNGDYNDAKGFSFFFEEVDEEE